MTIQRVSRWSGIGGGKLPPVSSHGGGEKVFFDDGRVKVTESLVTIGPPWNKAFAVSQIRGVTYGKNRSQELTNSFLQLVGMVLILAGILCLAAGLREDAPYSVSLDFGGAWATEYLSTRSEVWADAVANAIQEAMRQGRDSGAESFIPGQDRLRN
ncbi:MAG: hypothetical protein EBT95_03410 [Verrucomicrobia bacterium]|nr:hypothetical protein [Verrucomicrobiota bacterium]